MINFIKKIGRWIKKKILWLLLITGVVTLAFAYNPPIVPTITAPENNAFTIGVQNYQTEFKGDITDDKPLQYKLGDKFISFKPIEMRWDKKKLKVVKSSLKENKEYKEVFGEGIDLIMNTSDRVWSKVIKIESLSDLGVIPSEGFLEIEFEVETNFIIDGWNKKDDFYLTETTRLGDFSYIEPAKSWDSATTTQIESYFTGKEDKLFFIKKIPVALLKDGLFPVYTDVDITYGTRSQAQAQPWESITTVELDTDKWVTCGMLSSVGRFQCVIGTIATSSTSITYGAVTVFDTSITLNGSCVNKLETDKFIVYWNDGDGTMSAQVASTTGTTISLAGEGNRQTDIAGGALNTSQQGNDFCDQIADNKSVFVYKEVTSLDGMARIATTSPGLNNSVITFGTASEFEDDETRYPNVCKADDDKLIVFYENQTDSDRLHTRAVTVDGVTIGTWGTEVTVNGTDDGNLADCDQNETDKVTAHWNNNTDTAGDGAIFTLSGTTISVGTVANFETAVTNMHEVIAISATNHVGAWSDTISSNAGRSKFATTTDTIITFGSEITFETASVGGAFSQYGLSGDLISTNKIVICYQNDDNADTPYCIIGLTKASEPDAPAGGDDSDPEDYINQDII